MEAEAIDRTDTGQRQRSSGHFEFGHDVGGARGGRRHDHEL